MSTAAPARRAESRGDQCVTLRGIGWAGYRALLKMRGERRAPKIIYLDGDALLVSPSFPHELMAERLGTFVTEVVVGLDIPCIPAGSTTYRRRKKQAGAEPDKSFYLANEERIRAKRGKEDIHIRTDPPPDLVVEAVYTHDVAEAPEAWVCDGLGLTIRVRRANGRYGKVETSAAFPFLKAEEIAAWILKPEEGPETDWIKALRRWVREVLAPRYRPNPP